MSVNNEFTKSWYIFTVEHYAVLKMNKALYMYWYHLKVMWSEKKMKGEEQ
jgi:hypothetical protein